MVVIADLGLSVDALELGQVFDHHDDIELEFERVVPLGGKQALPLVWVTDGDPDAVEATLRNHPQSDSVSRLTRTGDRTLFEVRWTADDDVVGVLVGHDVHVLEGVGTGDGWRFRLRFDGRDEVTRFHEALTDLGVAVTLHRLFSPSVPSESPELSDAQRAAVEAAYERGYFEVPRRTTITRLAEEFGISDNAFSQRLRRGLGTLVERTLMADS
jgi:predicted DNA binding protein